MLADNARAIACYRRCGFREEGREREAALVDGTWRDDLVMGILAHEHTTQREDPDDVGAGAEQPWVTLAPHYERARGREDSLDRLVEWPPKEVLGDVTGRSVLDVGCGDGSKLVELVRAGARACVGVDVSGHFVGDGGEGGAAAPDPELVQCDLNELESIPGVAGRTFDRVLFLQSFGYATDPVRTLRTARSLLTDDGFVLLTRTHPIRYAVERTELNGTSLGEEYYSTERFSYATGWNDQVRLHKQPSTIADLLTVFSAAGLWVETAVEPQLSDDDRRRHPHKQRWMDTYLGILVFRLRPHPGR